MAKARTLVGLDVHATKIVAAVLDAETGELQCFTLSGDVSEAAGLCAGLPRPVRHGMRFDDGQAWTQRHRDWLAEVALAWPAAQATMLDAQGAIDALAHRRGALDREIVALLPTSPWAGHVARLRCLRGIDTLTAVGLCSEIADFERFAKAEQLMSYV